MIFLTCFSNYQKKQIASTPFFVLSSIRPSQRQRIPLSLKKVSSTHHYELRTDYLLQDSHKCTHFQCVPLYKSCEWAEPPSNPHYGAVEL